MTAATLMSRPSPSGATRPLPSLSFSPSSSTSPASVITLPRLHIPSDAAPSPFHSFASAPLAAGVVLKPLTSLSAPQYDNRSPQSPASFAPTSPSPEPTQFGLAHLLEAAEQCQEFHNRTNPSCLTQHPSDTMAPTKSRLHSIDYLISRNAEDERPAKRARPELHLDVNATYQQYRTPQAFHHSPQSVFQTAPYETTTPVFQNQHATPFMNITPVGSHDEAMSQADSQLDAKNVWETVLVTGNFPNDICLSENPSCCNKSNESSGNPVKQGRWTNDEKEFAENLIQQVRNGEVSLPPNTSLRKFIADSLQCKAMRVSKKFRSLRACQSPDGSSGDDRKFNPLSLHSIMNDDADADSFDEDMEQQQQQQQQSPKQSSKALKRSDYSQHGAVRSGRWSLEEENYAKAMIEAFKNGYLPLHGNVSLRKFLSEVLVCHPMRISKKFVGYVRKYHWYRIAAGKCDPEAKRVALEQLCHLEREFWASLQQNQEWATIQQENRR